ncbi:DUF6192 family protein [Streptomyces violaceusniger]|uniref:DUF6192 family protein n=1 Tax=Streptomyces violaceusniger TaxID=68280 RepID=UPI00142F30C7
MRRTPDAANRQVGRQVENPETPREKITAIRSPARDEEIAAAVTTDFLQRPQIAAKSALGGQGPGGRGVHHDKSGATTTARPVAAAGRRLQGHDRPDGSPSHPERTRPPGETRHQHIKVASAQAGRAIKSIAKTDRGSSRALYQDQLNTK